MDLFKTIIIRLLYFTPFGYAFSLMHMAKDLGNEQTGFVVTFPQDKKSSINITVVPNPTFHQRASWVTNGLALLVSGTIAFITGSKSETRGFWTYYAAFSIPLGIAQIVSGLFPRINWNKKLLP